LAVSMFCDAMLWPFSFLSYRLPSTNLFFLLGSIFHTTINKNLKFDFLISIKVWTQGLTLAMQVLYHLSHHSANLKNIWGMEYRTWLECINPAV
jgi:hypothetical protein